jgi:hypothetical protein
LAVNFFDSSALQHAYIDNDATTRVRRLIGTKTSECWIADPTALEMPSALGNRCRQNGWGLKRFDALYGKFLLDVARERVRVRPTSPKEQQRAVHLIRFACIIKNKKVTTFDALIAAAALECAMDSRKTVDFYTSDWALFLCLKDLSAFRAALNLHYVGTSKDGSPCLYIAKRSKS